MNFKKFLIALALSIPFMAGAVNITVPSAPGSNYVLLSTTTGAYISVATSSLGISGGGGGSPGGNQYDVQLNDGSSGFAGSDNLNFQGGYLTINGDSGYGQLQWLNSPLTGGYAGSGISGTDNEIIVGGLAGDMNFWSSQAMNFSADAGGTNMLRINTDGTFNFSGNVAIGPYNLSRVPGGPLELFVDNDAVTNPELLGFTEQSGGGTPGEFGDIAKFTYGSVDGMGLAAPLILTVGPTTPPGGPAMRSFLINASSLVLGPTTPISDNSNVKSIDTNARLLYASDGTTLVIDWTNIYNPLAALSFTADQAVFASTIKSSGDPYPSIDTNARYLIDNTGVVSTDWLNRVLYAADGNTKLVDFTNTTNTFAALSFDIGSAVFNAPIQATDNTKSVDTNSRLLYDSGGSTVIIDYSDTFNAGAALSFTSGGYMIPRYGLADTSSNATIFTDERVLVASDGSTNVIAWNPAVNNAFTAKYWFDSNNSDRITGDGSGLTGINATNANYLYDMGGGGPFLSVDGVNHLLLATDGTTKLVDFTNTQNTSAAISFQSFNGSLAGNVYIRPNIGSIVDNNQSIDPNNRQLLNPTGSGYILDWSGSNPNTAAYWFDSGNSNRLTGDGSGLTSLQSSSLTGPLPSIDGSALTNITQTQVNTASSVTGLSGTYNFDAITPGNVTSETFTNGVLTAVTTL